MCICDMHTVGSVENWGGIMADTKTECILMGTNNGMWWNTGNNLSNDSRNTNDGFTPGMMRGSNRFLQASQCPGQSDALVWFSSLTMNPLFTKMTNAIFIGGVQVGITLQN